MIVAFIDQSHPRRRAARIIQIAWPSHRPPSRRPRGHRADQRRWRGQRTSTVAWVAGPTAIRARRPGLARSRRCFDGRSEVEVPLAAPDGRRGHDHRGKRRSDRRVDRRLPRARRQERGRAVSVQHGRADRWRCRAYAAAGQQYIAVVSGSPSNFWADQNRGAPTIFVFGLP
jgi:hypothetical protein